MDHLTLSSSLTPAFLRNIVPSKFSHKTTVALRGRNHMRRSSCIASAFFILLLVSTLSFSQSSNASLSGTVTDAAKALIPGVTVTATNTETGVVSTGITNETGTYSIPSLLPGVYKVSAELPGFQTQTSTDDRLGNAAQARLNFGLQVASLSTTVEVTASAERLLLES